MSNKNVEFKPNWESVYQYINRAIFRCHAMNDSCKDLNEHVILNCEFNGGKFDISTDSTPDSAYADWNNSMEANRIAYEQSEEYANKVKKDKERQAQMNLEVTKLLKDFEVLPLNSRNLYDMSFVLNWLCAYQPYSDSILCTAKRDSYVVEKLKESGFVSNARVGEDLESADAYYEWLVGQAISTMEYVALHGCIISFTEKWHKTFLEGVN